MFSFALETKEGKQRNYYRVASQNYNSEIVTNVNKLAENKYEVSGDTNIYDFAELIETDEDEFDTEYTTVGGWVTDIMGHIPDSGETIKFGRFAITAVDVDEIKVEKVIIELL